MEGYLVDQGDTERMAERSLEILTNKDRRQAMGKAGRATAKARFCADEIVAQYENYYERVLSRV